MQHPEFEEGPCTASRPDPVPGLDAKSTIPTRSKLYRASTAASSPRSDFVKNYRVHASMAFEPGTRAQRRAYTRKAAQNLVQRTWYVHNV